MSDACMAEAMLGGWRFLQRTPWIRPFNLDRLNARTARYVADAMYSEDPAAFLRDRIQNLKNGAKTESAIESDLIDSQAALQYVQYMPPLRGVSS